MPLNPVQNKADGFISVTTLCKLVTQLQIMTTLLVNLQLIICQARQGVLFSDRLSRPASADDNHQICHPVKKI